MYFFAPLSETTSVGQSREESVGAIFTGVGVVSGGPADFARVLAQDGANQFALAVAEDVAEKVHARINRKPSYPDEGLPGITQRRRAVALAKATLPSRLGAPRGKNDRGRASIGNLVEGQGRVGRRARRPPELGSPASPAPIRLETQQQHFWRVWLQDNGRIV